MRRSLLIITLLSTLPFCLTAKENKDLMKADYHYRHLAYHEAIPHYLRVAREVKDPLIYDHLADCYRLTGNTEKAAEWYGNTILLPDFPSTVPLKYGQTLMQLARYDSAAKYLGIYLAANPG